MARLVLESGHSAMLFDNLESCACRGLTTWVRGRLGAASSSLAPNPCGSWLPGQHALHALRCAVHSLLLAACPVYHLLYTLLPTTSVRLCAVNCELALLLLRPASKWDCLRLLGSASCVAGACFACYAVAALTQHWHETRL